MHSPNEVNLRLDDSTRDALDAYALKLFPKRNGEGNRSEAIRQILSAVLQYEEHPVIAYKLENDMVNNGDILVFIRTCVSHYLEAHTLDGEHNLQ